MTPSKQKQVLVCLSSSRAELQATSSFVDTSLDDAWSEFLKMWQHDGFTQKKLRIRLTLGQ